MCSLHKKMMNVHATQPSPPLGWPVKAEVMAGDSQLALKLAGPSYRHPGLCLQEMALGPVQG